MFVRSFAIGVSAAALMVGGAQAADLIIPTTPQPIMESYGFDWEGMYFGIRAGGQFLDGDTFGRVDGTGVNNTNGVIGAAAGVNFVAFDPVLLGVEVTADYTFGNDGVVTDTGEFFANLRAGAVITDNAMVYALGGVGVNLAIGQTEALYQLGGGVEFAVTDAISVRGEVVGQGDFDNGDDFFEATKATVGVFYHF